MSGNGHDRWSAHIDVEQILEWAEKQSTWKLVATNTGNVAMPMSFEMNVHRCNRKRLKKSMPREETHDTHVRY
ncbi:MAG: hypothetical protein OXE85_07360, partial [Roseovarius sp.]|nr:hypothetical protein [Roseovarius sp.]